MNERDEIVTAEETGGAFADGLTLIRILLTPLVMFLIYKGWTTDEAGYVSIDVKLTAFASFLFVIAAITDILDDYFGGGAKSIFRKFGYLDDIADTILVVGTLGMLAYVVHKAGMMAWPFAIPVFVIIAREVLVGLFKGFELSRFGWPDNRLSSAKGGFIMLGTCLLLASPWLTQWIDLLRADEGNVMEVFNTTSPYVWIAGQVCLWIGALFSLLSAYKIFTTKLGPANDAQA